MTWDRKLPLKLLWFYLGLAVMGGGMAMFVRSGLGAAPWDVFHLGVVSRTALGLGLVSELAGLVIILINWLMGIKPTLGTVLNMLTFGPIMQVEIGLLPRPEALLFRWLMLLVGIFLMGFGTGLYVSADLGSGPRDGLMIGLTRRLGVSVGMVKNTMDICIAVLGWWLGGPLGLGTAAVALGQGPAVQIGLNLVARMANLSWLAGFIRPVQLNRS
jgi:uncharacterized membrane protein YczE